MEYLNDSFRLPNPCSRILTYFEQLLLGESVYFVVTGHRGTTLPDDTCENESDNNRSLVRWILYLSTRIV